MKILKDKSFVDRKKKTFDLSPPVAISSGRNPLLDYDFSVTKHFAMWIYDLVVNLLVFGPS
jgi:hypothetical protein